MPVIDFYSKCVPGIICLGNANSNDIFAHNF